jgi:hypothetical protein
LAALVAGILQKIFNERLHYQSAKMAFAQNRPVQTPESP